MKKVKVQDLLKKTQKDLHQDLEKLQLELNKLRVEATMRKPSEDNSSAQKVKKQIARTQTAINQIVKQSPVNKEAN
ncbi:50S ribosomal protein L29 [Candidatus Saccharibacteria bacterium]|jgi:ribosomal protein L29|nr:50S ribosomal protein L29 [Candidatus Saccharibacteria bacterium]